MKSIFLISLFLFKIFNLSSTIINIPADQPTIQQGIDASVNGDTVIVQPGTYIENINYNGKNITVASLFLTTQDTTYISETIIDGNQNGSVVTFESGEDSTTVLAGFTIQNGTGKEFTITSNGWIYYVYKGGGIYCKLSFPELKNLIVQNNISNKGGGFFIENNPDEELNQNLMIENCMIRNNEAESGTQYMFFYKGQGGGVYSSCSNTNIKNVKLYNNVTEDGGGICSGGSNLELFKVEISGNQADAGSAIYSSSSNIDFVKTLITNNIDMSFIHNDCIHIFNTVLRLINCTICNNNSGIAFLLMHSEIEIINSILWNNENQMITFADFWDPNCLSISYTNIENGENTIETNNNGEYEWLEGNIDSDPLFLDPENGDFHLTENSPCIDAGDPDSPLDPDGTIADMGAFYFNQNSSINEELIMNNERIEISNYPNPFSSSTTISFNLTAEDTKGAEIEIYNIKGQKVRTLECVNYVDAKATESLSHIVWDGKDDSGKPVNSGIYFYKLKSGKFSSTKKMILIR